MQHYQARWSVLNRPALNRRQNARRRAQRLAKKGTPPPVVCLSGIKGYKPPVGSSAPRDDGFEPTNEDLELIAVAKEAMSSDFRYLESMMRNYRP